MSRPTNVIWIMCDHLRYDYLGCTGHPTLKTPNIDAMAKRGVRFSNAYVQSPICGPSRMSFYTGRYMRSHGSHWNGWPLRIGRATLGDHLKKIGVRNVLVGKTHMAPDLEGLKMLGIAPDSIIGVHVAECGFEPYERDDGLHPTGRPRPRYDAYLRERGYDAENPWEHWANSGAAEDGTLQNGWLLVHADKAARIPDEHSETPYMTRRAMDFIAESEVLSRGCRRPCWIGRCVRRTTSLGRGGTCRDPAEDRAAREALKCSSLRANGSRECAPDDRLREAIHRSAKKEWIASSLTLLAMTTSIRDLVAGRLDDRLPERRVGSQFLGETFRC